MPVRESEMLPLQKCSLDLQLLETHPLTTKLTPVDLSSTSQREAKGKSSLISKPETWNYQLRMFCGEERKVRKWGEILHLS